MAKLLFDTWALLELLNAGPKAKEVKRLLIESERFTTTLNLYEVFYRVKQDGGEARALQAVELLSANLSIIPIDFSIALAGGKARELLKSKSNNMGAIDILTYVSSQTVGATLVTGDPDFKDILGVILL